MERLLYIATIFVLGITAYNMIYVGLHDNQSNKVQASTKNVKLVTVCIDGLQYYVQHAYTPVFQILEPSKQITIKKCGQ